MESYTKETTPGLFADSRKGNLLFHYTSLNSAVSIISTKSLLFSPLSKMNDMDESWRPIMCSPIDGLIDICEKEISSYVQISLTGDDNPNIKGLRRGFDIATMWGHYASGGDGVCIVFNKERIETVAAETENCHSGYVQYEKEYDSAVMFHSTDLKKEIEQRMDEIFLCKSDQWCHEQEYRIIKKKTPGIDRLDISSSIEAVIYAKLGAKDNESVQNTRGHWTLKQICKDIPLFGYVPRMLDGSRSIITDSGEKCVWSSKETPNLESGEWRIDCSY